MFGYVMPFKPELKIREYDLYKSYYCGLCREISKKSVISKFMLTYDMTFLSLLLSSIYEKEREEIKKHFCPYKAKNIFSIDSNLYLKYAADMNIILSNRKLIDNYFDTDNPIYYFMSNFIKAKEYTEIAKLKINKIDYYLKQLRNLEKHRCNNIDEVGHNFAEITSEILTINDDRNSSVLRRFGYNLGKWIYTIDAFDDVEKDIKNKNYNPILYRFNYKGENAKEFKLSIKDNMEFTLIKCLDEISKAFELLEFKRNRGIIENIVYIGLERKTKSIIEGGCKSEKSI